MPSSTSKQTTGDTPENGLHANPGMERTDAQWDEWLRSKGLRPTTPEESKRFAHGFTPCPPLDTPQGGNRLMGLVHSLVRIFTCKK